MDANIIKTYPIRSLLLIAPIILATLGIYFNSRPYTYVVRGESAIVCDTGKTYPTAPNDINNISGLRAYIENGSADARAQSEDLIARKLCSFGVINDFIPFRNVPDKRNYILRPGIADISPDVPQDTGVILSNK